MKSEMEAQVESEVAGDLLGVERSHRVRQRDIGRYFARLSPDVIVALVVAVFPSITSAIEPNLLNPGILVRNV